MREPDANRLERWKCLYCGSHKKDIGILKDEFGNRYGSVIVCHHCGRVEFFARSIIFATQMLKLSEYVLETIYNAKDQYEIENTETIDIDISKYLENRDVSEE